MSFEENLNKISNRAKELSNKLSENLSGEEYVKYSKEYSELSPIVENINKYYKVKEDILECEGLLKDSEGDREIRDLAEEELYKLKKRLPELESDIKRSLIPKDEADSKNVILEIRAGTG